MIPLVGIPVKLADKPAGHNTAIKSLGKNNARKKKQKDKKNSFHAEIFNKSRKKVTRDSRRFNIKFANIPLAFSTFTVQFGSMDQKNIRILLVDDETDILEFLGYNLQREGFQVFKAVNGEKAVRMAEELKPHLVILDVMMPGMDGIEACNRIRNIPGLGDILIAFLTARGEDYSQIAGFEAGADDYITKPIKPKLFISRVQALLRRIKMQTGHESVIRTQNLTIDRNRFIVNCRGEDFVLARKEFELLHFLVTNKEKVVTRDEIFEKVWGGDVVVGDRTIDVHIRRIREKLDIDNIRTIKGVGYKFSE